MLKHWRVLAIAIVWAIFGVANLVRAGMAAYIAPALAEYPPSVPLLLLGSVYGLWGAIFLAAAIITWRRKSSGGAFGLALAYQAVLWMLNLFGYRSAYARSLWPRDLLLTLIFLALIALVTRRKKAQ
ncbi:MAG: hypothetical protein WHX52_18385 [Anaerolineae bacterium]